jgi:polyisoprenyl-phosphate glycosyltransferase
MPACLNDDDDTPVSVVAVIPCFNEEACIAELHARLGEACRAVAGDSFRIVLVNDASTDRTWPLIRALSATDPHVIGVDLSRNHGHQLALMAGLAMANGERIFVADADLQDPPELLIPMMERLDAGADVVYGQRRKREGESLFKRTTGSLFYRFLDRLTDIPIPRDTGDFRLMTRRALEAVLAMPEQFPFVRGMVSWVGYRQEAFVYDRAKRFAGTTHYPLAKMLRLAIDAITGFSTVPLRLASYLGILLSILSIPLIGYTLVSWLLGETVAGWASLMTVVVFLGGVQMLVLGLIGEYLGRTYMQTKGRPLFLIQEITGTVSMPQYARANRFGFLGQIPSTPPRSANPASPHVIALDKAPDPASEAAAGRTQYREGRQ